MRRCADYTDVSISTPLKLGPVLDHLQAFLHQEVKLHQLKLESDYDIVHSLNV